MKLLRLAAIAAARLLCFGAAGRAQTTLRIGLAEDPGLLDPTLARTYVGRIVFASFCDKLFDIDDKLNIVPQLALMHETRPTARRSPSSCARASNSRTARLSMPRRPNTRSSAT